MYLNVVMRRSSRHKSATHALAYLLLRALLYERVIQHDALVLEEAVHVGVAVAAALGAIHLVELREGEVQAACQVLDLAAQVALEGGCTARMLKTFLKLIKDPTRGPGTRGTQAQRI